MDEQLKNLIEGAKKQGATDNDIKKIIDMYIADQKKKGFSEPTSQEGAGVSPTRTTQPSTSSDTEPPTRAQASVALGGPFQSIDPFGGKGAVGAIVSEQQKTQPSESYAVQVFKKSKSEVDENTTEERLLEEKNQSGILNNLGAAAKSIWNVTGAGLSSINEALGGTKDYFTIDEYKPLQEEKIQAKRELEKEGLPVTGDNIQKRAEDIFRINDKRKQLEKRIDANLPEDYDRQGIWKELKLDNLKKNSSLKEAFISADIYQSQIKEFEKYHNYFKTLSREKITQEQVDKYNDLLGNANESLEGLKYLDKNFPKILEEVKSSDELLDVFKYNYNDYEKHLSNIKNFAKGIAGGTVKLAAETLSYIDEKTDKPGNVPTEADKILKKGLQATKEIANEVLDEASEDREQFIKYKAKDISNFSDVGSFMAGLGTEQIPVWTTLAIAPELGSVLLGAGTGGEQFRTMEIEESQPFAKKTSFGQKLATSYMYGGAEALFERLGTVSVLKNIEKSIAKASNPSRKLIEDGVMQEVSKLGKQFGYNFGLEGGTEYLTAEAQIAADRYIAGKEISTQQANERRFESFVAGGLMGGGMTMIGGVWGAIAQNARIYSDNKDIKKTKEILSQIERLSDEIKNNPNLTPEERVISYKKMNELANQSFDIVSKNANKGKDFNAQETQFLVDINVKQAELKAKLQEIKDSNFSKEQKQTFINELKDEYSKLEEKRNTTLQGGYNKLTELPSAEVIRLKDKAARELMKELNPDGTKTITINDSEITKRAIQLLESETKAPAVEEMSVKPAEVNEEKIESVRSNFENGNLQNIEITPTREGFDGDFLNDYEFLAEGSEHTVYRSKDGKTVIKIGEPYGSNEGFMPRVEDALRINNLIGDNSLEVIGFYESNGVMNPVYQQNYIDGNIMTQEEVASHLESKGFVNLGNNKFAITVNGKTYEISDTSDNFIIDNQGNVSAIDAGIIELDVNKLTEEQKSKLKKPTEAKSEVAPVETINLEQITKNSYVDRISRYIIEKVGNNWVVKTEVEGKELFKSKTLKGAKEFVSNDNQEALRVQPTEAKEEAAKPTDTEATATEEIAPSDIETTLDEVITPASSNIKEQIARAKKALSKLLPNVEIVYHETAESFFNTVGRNDRGFYNMNKDSRGKNIIHINGSNATNTTVAHEVFHAVLLNYILDGKPATRITNRMLKAVAKSLASRPDVIDKINTFVEEGYSDEKEIWAEEKLSEVLGYLASEYETLPDVSKNIIQKWLEKIAVMLKMKPFTDKQVLDFMNAIATKVAYGQEITEGDVGKVLGKEKVTDSNAGNRKQAVSLMKGTENLVKYGLKQGKNITRKVGEALEKRQRQKYGYIEQNDRSESAKNKISNWMVDEVKYFIETMGDKSGKGWYGEKYQKALDNMAKIFPEMKSDKNARDLFTILVAITSDGQKVLSNFKLASFAYDYYKKNGTMPSTLPGQRTASFEANLKRINKLLSDYKGDIASIKKDLMEIKSIEELNKERKKGGLDPLNTSWPVSFKAPFAASVFGPKLGMFYSNLSGNEAYPTLDRWWSRTFNRYRGTLIPSVKGGFNKKGEALGLDRFKQLLGSPNMSNEEAILASKTYRDSYAKKGYKNGTEAEKAANTIYKIAYENLNDAPFNKTDRQFMYESVSKALSKLNKEGYNLSIADVQAILWYFEKNLYKTLGVQANIEGISYEEAANTTFEKWKSNNNSFDYNIKESEDDAGVEGADEDIKEEENEVKGRRQISPENSSNYANMTEDGKGNFVFYHFGPRGIKAIDPKRYGSNKGAITSKPEIAAMGRVGGMSQFYTMPEYQESNVSGDKYMIKVPMDKVYDFNTDPENFYDRAREMFKAKHPDLPFTANDQLAYITKLAEKAGYDMTVAEWNDMSRAQSTKALKPVDTQVMDGNVISKPFQEDYESNSTKGFESVIPTSKEAKLKDVYQKINAERNSKNRYDSLYSLAEDFPKLSQDKITDMIENSDISQEMKDAYAEALAYEPGARMSGRKQKSPIDTAVETAKRKGFNDKEIADYLVGKGYTRAQATNAILRYNKVTAEKLRKEDSVFTKEGRNKIITFLDQVKRRALSAKSFLPKSVFILKEGIEANIKAEAKRASYLVDDFNKLVKGYKGDLNALNDEFDKYLRGDQTAVLPDEFKAVAGKMRMHIDNLSQMLLRTGAVTVSQVETIAANLGQYINRSYQVFDKKNWAKQVTEEMKEAARVDLRNMYRASAEAKAKQTGMDADIILEKFINDKIDELISGESAATFLGIGKTGSKDLSIMKQRLDIPLSIRQLMGEYTDASQNYARTVIKIATLAENARFLQSARDAGMGVFFFKEGDLNKPSEFNVQIAGEGSETMNPLNGLFTTKEIADSFKTSISAEKFIEGFVGPNVASSVVSLYTNYMKLLSVVKWNKTIASVATHFKNVTGNIWFMLSNGYFNYKKYGEAFNVLKNSSNEQLRDKLDEYIRAGIIDQSAALGEIKSMFSDADFDTAIENRLKKNPIEKAKKAARWVITKLNTAYQLEDDFYKIVSYESEKDRYSNAEFQKPFDQLTEDQKIMVSNIAAENTKNVLPNYARIPGLVKLIKIAPVTGTFISFQAEAYRTAWNTVALAFDELSSSNKKIKAIGAKRLAGIAFSQSVKFGLMTAIGTVLRGGDDDDEEDKLNKNVREFVPEWSKKSDLVLVEYGNGKFSYVDFGASDPHGGIKKAYNSFMAGDGAVESFTNGMSEILGPFVKKDMLLEAITDVNNNENSYGGKLYNDADTNVNKINAVAERFYKVLEPGSLTSARKIAQAENVGNELAGQLTGYKVITIDVGQQLGFKMNDSKKKITEGPRRLYNSAFYKFEDGKMTAEELESNYKQANSAQKEIYKSIMDNMKAASFFGVEDRVIDDAMEGIGKGVVNDLWYGDIPDMKQKQVKLTDAEFRAKYGEKVYNQMLRGRELLKKGAK